MKFIVTTYLLIASGLLVANPFAKPSEVHGILQMNISHPSEDIFPVSLYAIDGKQIIKRHNAAWLKPGKHTIRVSALIPLDNRGKALSKRQKVNNHKNNNVLELNIEAGKTYSVGYDTSSRDPNLWRPVVWKIK